MRNKIKILMISSATGGHAIPVKVLLEAFNQSGVFEVSVIHSGSEIEKSLFSKFNNRVLISGKLHRHEKWRNIWQTTKLILAIIKSLYLLVVIKPHVVFSKGGFNSYPILFWAKLLRIPYFLHETDSVMGMANRAFYQRAEKAFVSFPISCYDLVPDKLVYSGMIVREFPTKPSQPHQRAKILVMGGSQGSVALNRTVIEALPELLGNYEIFLALGTSGLSVLDEVGLDSRLLESKKYFHQFPFSFKKVEELLPQSDLIISRAGGSIGEIAKLKKASILIPYPYAAADHQMKNARFLEKQGGAIVIKEENFNVQSLMDRIKFVLTNTNAKLIGEHASKALKTDGEKIILKEISKYFGVK